MTDGDLKPGNLVVPESVRRRRGVSFVINSYTWANIEWSQENERWTMVNKLGKFTDTGILLGCFPDRQSAAGRSYAVMLLVNDRVCWTWSSRIRRAP